LAKGSFDRWFPAMAGRRSQGFVRKYIMEAATEIETKGIRLSERLYVPEQFRKISRRRSRSDDRSQLALPAFS